MLVGIATVYVATFTIRRICYFRCLDYHTYSHRDLTVSSVSLLELLDSGDTSSNTQRMCSAPRQYDGRVREGSEREERTSSGTVEDGLTGEESGDESGFEYTTTANIARHLRSDVTGGIYEGLRTRVV